ncbi:prophage tail fiber N-terminal domain-containing protein [Serratia liquefaciens]|uniref:prophage tail fiber N-terminal domain-containing protein n=1 Tax=Serratia liquefaciens TaxID=614 RepID=UPI0015A20FB8|nr:prophage tail fiber N-terminal domain-containing protein [Serratia liquefaciens]NWA20341.1 prophage tail fiber N-terminal domain-containing protein [Serratia liquefaciens]
MSILVEGTLLSPAGHVIGNADIVLTSISTSLVVLGGTPQSAQTDPGGNYSFTLNNGNFAVSVSKDGNNWFSGMITVTDITMPKSLNALILHDAMMAEIPVDYWSYFQSQTGILFSDFSKIEEAVEITTSSKDISVAAKNEAVSAKDSAKASAVYVQNVADANTYIITPEDPDGTIAGIAGTPNGKSFRVGQGVGNGFKTYVNKDGVALEISGSLGANDLAIYVSHDANNNIELSSDANGNTIAVNDEFGGAHIVGVEVSVQEKIESLDKNKGPYLNLLSDADNAAYGAVDEYGHLHLPDMQSSIQDMMSSQQKKIESLIKNRRVLDVRECGFNAKKGENATYAIQRAIDWLRWNGGGIVYLPEAFYPLSTFIIPRNNVSIIGAGDKSVLLPYKQNTAIKFVGTHTNYLENVLMSNFKIEGENQVLLPGAKYVPDIKGTYIKHWRNCVMDNVTMLNIGATALGNDMADNCSIIRCRIENFGRLAPSAGSAGIWERPLGASGIGIGTGAFDDEPLYMAFNTVKNGTNFPLFLEPQGGGAARGAIAISNILMGGYAGLADCGVDGFQAIGNQMRLNKFGILRYPGTNNDGKPGRRAQYISNIVDSNEDHGIYSYSTKTDPLIGWNIYAYNQVTNNGKDGVNFRYTNPSVVMQNETVDSNHINGNGRHGINIEEAKEVINCDFTNNKTWGNGQRELGHGVNSSVPFTACSINNNKIRDTQATVTQQYPVNLTGELTDVDISFNHCVGNAQNSLNLTGSQTRVTTNFNAGI